MKPGTTNFESFLRTLKEIRPNKDRKIIIETMLWESYNFSSKGINRKKSPTGVWTRVAYSAQLNPKRVIGYSCPPFTVNPLSRLREK